MRKPTSIPILDDPLTYRTLAGAPRSVASARITHHASAAAPAASSALWRSRAGPRRLPLRSECALCPKCAPDDVELPIWGIERVEGVEGFADTPIWDNSLEPLTITAACSRSRRRCTLCGHYYRMLCPLCARKSVDRVSVTIFQTQQAADNQLLTAVRRHEPHASGIRRRSMVTALRVRSARSETQHPRRERARLSQATCSAWARSQTRSDS